MYGRVAHMPEDSPKNVASNLGWVATTAILSPFSLLPLFFP